MGENVQHGLSIKLAVFGIGPPWFLLLLPPSPSPLDTVQATNSCGSPQEGRGCPDGIFRSRACPHLGSPGFT